jgi:Holliday junction resolvase RusA-like endonuclease
MKISTKTENCSYDTQYLIEESAASAIHINLAFEKIVSVQSRRAYKEQICNLIQGELSKFTWIISGCVNIDFTWYLHAVERQETDKVGDIDNITKPILDSLIGSNGVLIDDAQIRALYTYWLSRNELVEHNLLEIKISFNNDDCLEKSNLIFIQYANAICLPANVEPTDHKQLLRALLLVKSRQGQRTAAKIIRFLGENVDNYLVRSTWDFHRTRLNQFPRSNIYSVSEFKELCRSNGLTFLAILRLLREVRRST